jgi:hypothetical protein
MSNEGSADTQIASFIEHLRFVHFTLLATCLAAMIAITSTTTSYLERSDKETKQLLEVAEKWQRSLWFGDFAARESQKSFADTSKNEGSVVIFKTHPYRFSLYHGIVFATENRREVLSPPTEFNTISQSKEAWDYLNRYRFKVTEAIDDSVPTGWHVGEDGNSSDLKVETVGPISSLPKDKRHEDLGSMTFMLRADLLDRLSMDRPPNGPGYTEANSRVSRDNSQCYKYVGVGSKTYAREHYIIPVKCRFEPINLQAVFFDRAFSATARSRRFFTFICQC